MPSLLPELDPSGLLEYSVVFTDRSLNHMSRSFQDAMNDISNTLREVYRADTAVLVPGGGTYGMEAVARQFAAGKKCMVIRNGFFSYRWTQIFEMGHIPAEQVVLKARTISGEHQAPFAPVNIETAVNTVRKLRPDLVFAPHVETSAGMILPDDYLQDLANAVHEVGGLFVLDSIASGAMWVDMREIGVDILLSAPQKGWSASPSSGLVLLSEKAMKAMESTTSSSFSCDLKKWHQIMQAYKNGGHAYHATLPTDALIGLRNAMNEMREFGFENGKQAQAELGSLVRQSLKAREIPSVAAPGYEAPGVVVSYTDDPNIQNGSEFAAQGLQIAAGVPLMCDEPEGFRTFRIGLFGLDKLKNIQRSADNLDQALGQIFQAMSQS